VVIENSSTGAQIDSIALTGTSYSIPTTFLPGGIYSIKAHYGGDGKFGASDSPLVAVNSTKQGSKVIVSFVNAAGALVTSAQTVAYGSPYILRVDVANNAGTPCETISTGAVNFICPTGTVTLLDNAAALNDFPNAQTPNATNVAHLNNRGFIEDQLIQLNTGTHNITATYPGDASYNAGTSNTLSVTITQATTTTSVVGSPSTITSGGTVALTATVSSQSNADKPHAPSGTIQFMNGSTNIGAPVTCTQVGSTSSAGASCTATFSTTLSALAPPISFDNRWRRTPYELLAALFAMLAVIFFIATRRLRGPRRAYAYASVVAFLIASAALAGCSGPSSSGGGGGGTGKTITAKYSGDTNYTASQGSGTVTVH